MPRTVSRVSAAVVLVCGEDEFAVKQRAKQIYLEWTRELGGMDHEVLDASVSHSGEALKILSQPINRFCIHDLVLSGNGL